MRHKTIEIRMEYETAGRVLEIEEIEHDNGRHSDKEDALSNREAIIEAIEDLPEDATLQNLRVKRNNGY